MLFNTEKKTSIIFTKVRGHPFQSQPLILAYQGQRNVSFFKKFCVLTKWMVPNRTLGFFLSDHDSQDVEKTAQRTNIFFH